MNDTKQELLGSKYLTASFEPQVGFVEGVSDDHTQYNGHTMLGNDQAQFRYDDECENIRPSIRTSVTAMRS